MEELKYFYDLEFLEDGRTIDLISIGIVCEDGREYYAVNSEMPVTSISSHDWLCKNVVPQLPVLHKKIIAERVRFHVERNKKFYRFESCANTLDFKLDRHATFVKPRFVIANEVRDFFLIPDGNGKPTVRPHLWAWCGAYDHVCLCRLYGSMADIPDGFPHYTDDLKGLHVRLGEPVIPEQVEGAHNALEDARHNKVAYDVLTAQRPHTT